VVHSDTILSYWIRPENALGRSVGIDLLNADGRWLRDSGIPTMAKRPTHPSSPRGAVGKWTQVRIALGHYVPEHRIRAITFAFDSRRGPGKFSALIDDLRIESLAGERPWHIEFAPAPGPVPLGTRVSLRAPKEAGKIHFTVDGTTPDKTSPVYRAPIVLDQPGLQEIRAAAMDRHGKLSEIVLSAVYEVGGK
jgi:hypothetical protein